MVPFPCVAASLRCFTEFSNLKDKAFENMNPLIKHGIFEVYWETAVGECSLLWKK